MSVIIENCESNWTTEQLEALGKAPVKMFAHDESIRPGFTIIGFGQDFTPTEEEKSSGMAARVYPCKFEGKKGSAK